MEHRALARLIVGQFDHDAGQPLGDATERGLIFRACARDAAVR